MKEQPKSCDTFVVLPNLTQDNRVIFGKNSDRPRHEVQEVVYFEGKKHEPDSTVQCTYITIPQVPETQSVILSKPSWMFGAEMGSNGCGVVIGNEAVWSDYKSHESDVKRLLGMDLLRLGLERSTSAKSAIDVITDLLESYGQGGPCDKNDAGFSYFNSFIIADPIEAYVLETVHNVWVVERITSGYRNISNVYSIQTKIDFHSKNLFDEAKATGKWNGSTDLNFAAVFGSSNDGTVSKGDGRYAAGKALLQNHTSDKKFNLDSMTMILRDKMSGICRDCYNSFPTASSQVSLLSAEHLNIHYFTGTPDSSVSVFKPFVFAKSSKNELTTLTKSPETEDGKHDLYVKHEAIYPILKSKNADGTKLRQQLRRLEELCFTEMNQVMLTTDKDLVEDRLGITFNKAVDLEIELYQ
ncbi:secernin-3-like [Bradysia coprophila]|uniref:secernin-3-like n=1 Tax=Bradysia coprophila TaxID=38358 RepID=UPI00187DA218|nr:secernin-3-like [Bradysia coprophila]